MFARITIVLWGATILLAVPGLGLAEIWNVPGDFPTIQHAIDNPKVMEGDEIRVGPGFYRGAHVSKRVILQGSGRTYITDGPRPWPGSELNAGFMFRGSSAEEASGSKILDFVFQGVDFPIFSSQKGAVVSDITIQYCTMENAIQAITMWHADDWDVRFNRIVDLRSYHGGGIGILLGSFSGDDAYENLIADNEIDGVVTAMEENPKGYLAAGIYLVSNHSRGNRGGIVTGNRVQRNKITLRSEKPEILSVEGILLSETPASPELSAVVANILQNNSIFTGSEATTL